MDRGDECSHLLSDLANFLGAPTQKRYLRGSHRGRHPEDTWSLIEPNLLRFGITRVADVTGLDRLGIPVWMAVRPNSKTLSVTQGKGLDPVAARVSAAMEGIEVAHGERPCRSLHFKSYEALRALVPVVDVSTLPPMRGSLFTASREIFWIDAYDLIGTVACWVPYEMVHTDATVPAMTGSRSFLASTNGLASGNTLAEAVLHGLCEVIERDATALWEYSDPSWRATTRIDLSTVVDPLVMEVLERCQAAGLIAMAWNATSDIEIPVVRAVIFDKEADPVYRPLGAAFGAGCHPDSNVAFLRALTEAAQTRLTIISGSRDDFGRARYWSTQQPEAINHYRSLSKDKIGSTPFGGLPECASKTVDEDVAHVLDRLQAVGLTQALVVDLSLNNSPLSVVRIIVPGLEGPAEGRWYIPGRRVRALHEGGKSA